MWDMVKVHLGGHRTNIVVLSIWIVNIFVNSHQLELNNRHILYLKKLEAIKQFFSTICKISFKQCILKWICSIFSLRLFRFKVNLYPHHFLLPQKWGYVLLLLLNRGLYHSFSRNLKIFASIALVLLSFGGLWL